MLFNSLSFVLFATAVLTVAGAIGRHEVRLWLLLVASWLFYATWSVGFLVLLVAMTAFGWVAGAAIARAQAPARARRLCAWSVALVLGTLAIFKYGGFLRDQIAVLVPVPAAPEVLALGPPLGISFYSFHLVSYLVDMKRGARAPAARFRDFALYIAFFPQLIAGPITRWSFFGPQVERPRRPRAEDVDAGLFLLARGYVKKAVCADTLGGFVDGVWVDPAIVSRPEIVLAVYAYAFQIYFDFSGYTDIARGLARLLGFHLPENFHHPYLASSPREFWQRWHVTLSTWLRDYLYVPLGGNRGGPARTAMNLLATMTLGGLWHGAAWTFVVWGTLHGLWLAAHRRGASSPPRTPVWVRQLVTFHLVALGWIVFRAPSLGALGALAAGFRADYALAGPFPVGIALLVLGGAAAHVIAARVDTIAWWSATPRALQGAVVATAVVLIGVLGVHSQRFIYFQF